MRGLLTWCCALITVATALQALATTPSLRTKGVATVPTAPRHGVTADPWPRNGVATTAAASPRNGVAASPRSLNAARTSRRAVLAAAAALAPRAAAARNLPKSTGAAGDKRGTVEALAPVAGVARDVSAAAAAAKAGRLADASAALSRAPTGEKAFKRLFDEYSLDVSYKQRYRPPRGSSFDESRRRRGRDVDSPWRRFASLAEQRRAVHEERSVHTPHAAGQASAPATTRTVRAQPQRSRRAVADDVDETRIDAPRTLRNDARAPFRAMPAR